MKQQFHGHEDFGQSGPALRRRPGSISGRQLVRLEERPEAIFQHLDPLHDVSERAVPLRHRRTVEISRRVVEALVDDIDPEEEVREQDRIGTLLLGFPAGLAFRTRRDIAGFLSRACRFRPHGDAAYGEEMSIALTNPWNETARPGSIGIRTSNPEMLDGCGAFWVFAMFLYLEVALDASTREILSFNSRTLSGACAALQKLTISGVHPCRLIEVDRSRLEVWVEPDTA